MPNTDTLQRFLKAIQLFSGKDKTLQSPSHGDHLQVETLEPRMMLNGDAGEVLFQTGFEDVNLGKGQFGFFRNVSGFTTPVRPVEIQNSHPSVGPAAEGTKLLELDGKGEIFVDIRDVQAGSLNLDLQYSPRGGANRLENEIEVIWKGSVVETLSADGSKNNTTKFRGVSIDLPIEDGSTAGRLSFRSKTSGGRGLGGLLDDISVTAQRGPLVIQDVLDQTVETGSTVNVDFDLLSPDNGVDDVRFQLVEAPVGASINPSNGLFEWAATDSNIVATQARESRTVLGSPEVALFAGFEDVAVGRGQVGFFNRVSGFDTTAGAIEVQNNFAAVGPAAGSNQHVELSGVNGISRSVATGQGDRFELTFGFSPRPGVDAATNAIEVLWDGKIVKTITADGRRNNSTAYRQVKVSLPEGTGDDARLEFRSKASGTNSQQGGLIDNVRLMRQRASTVTSAKPFEVIVRSTDSNGRVDTERFDIAISDDTRDADDPLDDIADTPQLGPLVIQDVPDQTVASGSAVDVDIDLLPPDNGVDDVRFQIVKAPVGATINTLSGLFEFAANDSNIAATLERESQTVLGDPQVVLFAGFEDVAVSRGKSGLFNRVSGFTATGGAVEVQDNLAAVGPAAGSNQHVELSGTNSIFRSVATEQGDRFELIFGFSPRPGVDAATNAIEVLWNGKIVKTITADGRRNNSTAYRQVKVSLPEGTGEDTRLEFRSKASGTNSQQGGLIDNVRLTRQRLSTFTSEKPFEVIVRSTDSNGRADTEKFDIAISDNDIPPGEDPSVDDPIHGVVGDVRADYRDDFRAGSPAENWQYLWNAPDDWNGRSSVDYSTGGIGNPDNYVPLLNTQYRYTATGAAGSNDLPVKFLKLDGLGGHAGAGRSELNFGNTKDRYAIAAWTVDADGFYAIKDSFLKTRTLSGRVEVLVHVNDDEAVIEKSAISGASESFNTNLGYLKEGDVVYVAFGPEDDQFSDSFEQDFSIVRLTGEGFSLLTPGGQTSVSESGQTDFFEVVLHEQPTADVEIELTNSLPSEVSLSAQSLTFTQDNWNVAQSVTLAAVDDAVKDGLKTATIIASVAQNSNAAEFTSVESQSLTVEVDDDETLATLQSQIDQGLKAGLDRIVLTPGVYTTTPLTPTSPHLWIADAQDVSIVAEGVTLVATSLSSGVRIQNAQNVTLSGLTVDYDPLPFSQGTVVGVAKDNSYFDVKIHEGYSQPTDGSSTRAIIYNADNRRVKANTFTRFGSSVTALDNRIVRISDQGRRDALREGDLITLTLDTLSPHAVTIARSNSVRLEDVTVNASTAFAFFETESGGNEYENLKVTPGETPEGATQARLISSNYDSFHSKYATTGPKIVGANFNSAGDDGIAINGDFALVARATGNSVLITSKRADPHIRVGDRLLFSNENSDKVSERTVEAIEHYDVGDVNFSALKNKHLPQLVQPQEKFETAFRLTLSSSINAVEGDLVSNISRSGSGFEILDSSITNTRARGIVIKASDGLISGNTLKFVATTGILVSPEVSFWAESGFTNSLVIDNNRLLHIGYAFSNPYASNAGGILITADPNISARGHHDIQISNNLLKWVDGINLAVTNASNVVVADNQFARVHPRKRTHGSALGFDAENLVWLANVNDVNFQDNVLDRLGPNVEHLVFQSSTANNIKGLATGLTLRTV